MNALTSIENVKSMFREIAQFDEDITECLILEMAGNDIDVIPELRSMVTRIKNSYRVN